MDREDPILDTYLSEVLGGQTPPDLTARILQAWAAQGQDPSQLDPRLQQALLGAPIPPPLPSDVAWHEPVAPPIQANVCVNGTGTPLPAEPAVLARPARREKSAARATPWWASLTIAGGLLSVGAVGGYLAWRPLQNGFLAHWANQQAAPAAPDQSPEPINHTPTDPAPPHKQESKSGSTSPTIVDNQHRTVPSLPRFEIDKPTKFTAPAPVSAWQDAVASSDREIVTFVNQTLQASWKSHGVKPSPTATDAEWCRRTYLRLIGRVPSPEELASFTNSKAADKRAALADRLLFDKQYAEEYARYWANQWSQTLVGRGKAVERNELVSIEGLQQYLRNAVHTNKPYDKVVYELLSATGSNKPGTANFNGATNFLLANQNNKATQATAHVTRVFLGKQSQCAQCHNDPFNGSTQHQFWAMNSFFRQMQVQRNRETGVTTLANADFRGESGQADDAEVFYELRNGQIKVAYPQFAGIELPKSGRLSDVDRRQELAKLIAGSDDLSRAAVNRYWAHFLGYGFTRPADDMGEHNPAPQPAVLERLAKEFKTHNYNTKDLLRWIVLSEPFGLSSKVESFNVADAPQMGSQPLFSHYYSRPPQANGLQDSLVAAADIAKRGGTLEEQNKARLAWLGQFTPALDSEGGIDANNQGPLNSELTQHALSSEHSALLKRIADSSMQPEKKLEHLFLAAVARQPSKRELEIANQLVDTRNGDINAALPEIWWALLNSNESILDR